MEMMNLQWKQFNFNNPNRTGFQAYADDGSAEVYPNAVTYASDPEGSKWHGNVDSFDAQGFVGPYRTPYRAKVATESLNKRLQGAYNAEAREGITKSRTLKNGRKSVHIREWW
jgi:hypothetical protein